MTDDNGQNFKARVYQKDGVFEADPHHYYQIMGLGVFAGIEEIKHAYRNKAKELHPDYNKASDAELKFKQLQMANDILNDNLLRNIYNISCIAKYVESDKRIFSLDFKRCSECGCASAQLRYIKFAAKENIFCFKCSPRLKKSSIHKNKSFQVLLEQMLAFITAGETENAIIATKQALFFTNNKNERQALLNILEELSLGKEFFYKNEWAEPVKFFKPKKEVVGFILLIIILQGYRMLNPYKKNDEKVIVVPEVINVIAKDDNAISQKVLSIPVNIKDANMIYHVSGDVNVLHGAGEEYDLLRSLKKDTTIRLTGFVPNSSWVRIMMADGVVGFINRDYLKKGFGESPLPIDNVIFDGSPILENESK